jgi:hypothetical protein
MDLRIDLNNFDRRTNVPSQVMFVSGLRIFATWRLIAERIHCKDQKVYNAPRSLKTIPTV